jgi:nucleoside triphosphate diphosphatase
MPTRRPAKPRRTPSRTRRAARPRTPRARQPSAAHAAGGAFQRLVDIMARLRGRNGCPWDREQTIQSLRGFVLEETYEVLDAIDRGDWDALGGEIGDLIFEGVFLAQIASDEGHFSVADSLHAIAEKLVRRHPHVFGTGADGIETPTQVVEQWEQIKAREQKAAGQRRSLLAGVPKTLPSLLKAHEIGTRVAAVGFDWAHTGDVIDKIDEEVRELRQAAGEGPERLAEEMGDLLFSIAQLARQLGIESESALRQANEKFSERFGRLEAAFEARGESMREAGLKRLEAEWQRLKKDVAPVITTKHTKPRNTRTNMIKGPRA